MANIGYMQDQFESQKNMKAGSYTLLICGSLLVIFLFARWSMPLIQLPVPDEGIEVNLGNSEQGFGDDQPLLPGKPSPSDAQAYTPPKVVSQANDEVKDVETNDKDEEAPPLKKVAVVKPDAKKIAEKDIAKTTPKKVTQPVSNPTPAPPKPKAVFKGVNGDGTGGNDADTYKKGGNQGVAGGNGDQGVPGGDPNGKSYTGTPKNFGVKVLSIPNQSFEDDFDKDAKVAMDIEVNEAGKVTSANYQARGSTTSDQKYKEIARRAAFQLKLGASPGGQKGTVVFNFKVR